MKPSLRYPRRVEDHIDNKAGLNAASRKLTPIILRLFAPLLLTAITFLSTDAAAEEFTLSGYVRDSASNEDLISASIYAIEAGSGTLTNGYGFYSLTLPEGEYTIRYALVGYERRDTTVSLISDLSLDMFLAERPIIGKSVIVKAEPLDWAVRKVEMGSIELSPAQLNPVPVIFGEQDILKTIQLLPGVQEAGEGNTGFHVRGGDSDQNLILLDEATVFNPGHFMGFFSVFNSDAIKDAKLIKGSGSAEYGGRLSSVLDIKMKEGNSKKFQGKAGVGLIASRLTVEGPIVKDRSSFMISGRRTYFDLFLKLSRDEEVRNSQLYFYDLNLKANYRFGRTDRVYLSGYFGRDALSYKKEFGIDWGNATGTARWNHIFSNQLFLNSSLIYSFFNYDIGIDNGDELIEMSSSISTVNLKEDFQLFPNPRSTFKFGGQVSYHNFQPGEVVATGNFNDLKLDHKYAIESALYANHEWSLTSNLSLDYGLRFTSFAHLGPGAEYEFDSDGLPKSVTEYEGGEVIERHTALEPRITARYMLDENNSVKASYARNTQYLHLLSTLTGMMTPFDRWHPSTRRVKPGSADQYAMGYFRNFEENRYEASVEVYYRDLRNQVDLKNGADVFFNEYVESEFVFGKGRAYGLEFLLKKEMGRLSGWLSSTISKTEKQFDAINHGEWFPARQDRNLDIEIAAQYSLNTDWTLGVNWVYYTGNAVTFPAGKYIVDDHVINLYTERNGYRMPAYHRLDLALTWIDEESSWNFSIFNAYGRRNAYAIQFREAEGDPSRTEAVRIALFTIMPSITYTHTF